MKTPLSAICCRAATVPPIRCIPATMPLQSATLQCLSATLHPCLSKLCSTLRWGLCRASAPAARARGAAHHDMISCARDSQRKNMIETFKRNIRFCAMSQSADLGLANATDSNEVTRGCGGSRDAGQNVSPSDEGSAAKEVAEHVVNAPITSQHVAPTMSDPAASAVSDMLQLRDVLNDMTQVQLRALAASWGLEPFGYSRRHQQRTERLSAIHQLHEHCSFMIDQASKPLDRAAIRRQIVTERYFDSDECSTRGHQTRARSASPSLDLTPLRFPCPICLDDVPTLSTFVMPCCGYETCKACAALSVKALMADNIRVRCPNCAGSLADYGDRGHDTLEILVGATALIAWKIQLALQAIPDCRQCAACNRIQLVQRAAKGFPSVACSSCALVSCFYHGDTHAGATCPTPTPQDMDSATTISSISLRCPRCKVATERNGGCPHMTCCVCACSWCWTCARARCSGDEAHDVILDTSVDNSSNFCSALLFRGIRFFAGANSIFSTPNLCACDGGGGGGGRRDFAWGQNGQERYGGDRGMFGHTYLIWLLLLAVTCFGALQRSSQWQRALGAYVFYACCASPILAKLATVAAVAFAVYRIGLFGVDRVMPGLYRLGWVAWLVGGGVVGFVWGDVLVSLLQLLFQCLPSHDSYYIYYYYPGPPRIANQLIYALLSHFIAFGAGLCVFGITMLSQTFLNEYRNGGCPKWAFELVTTVPPAAALLLLPWQTERCNWVAFWMVWALMQMLVGLQNSLRREDDQCGWAFFWGGFGAVLHLAVSMDHFGWCMAAMIVVVAVTLCVSQANNYYVRASA